MRIDGLGHGPLHQQIRAIAKNPAQPKFEHALGEAERLMKISNKSDSDSDRIMREILSKGLLEFAREQRMEKLRKKIRQQVMGDLGVTEGSLASLDASARQDLLERIEQEVERLLQERLRRELDEATQANWA